MEPTRLLTRQSQTNTGGSGGQTLLNLIADPFSSEVTCIHNLDKVAKILQ